MHLALVVLASTVALTLQPPSNPVAGPADTAKSRTSGATLGIKAPAPQNSGAAQSNTLNVDVPASEVLKEAREAKAAKLAAKQKLKKTPETRGENTPAPKNKVHKKHTPTRRRSGK